MVAFRWTRADADLFWHDGRISPVSVLSSDGLISSM